jgi:alkyldihydroxyacetonephosphate synthase
MYAIKYGTVPRVPDLVVYPEDEEQVAALVQAASRHDVCLIPYGGGTNVTNALRCPEDEERTIVSVDMQRMNRILWIDPVNRMACIEAGAVGRIIMSQLEQYGLTMGHEPDSVEFSTMGGWVATHCSGMKKNRYGNIEDLVLDVTAVTPQGKLERSSVAPRESVGADPRRWLYGSEGNLGIVTSAVVKVFPLPEVQRFGSIVFPSYEDGIAFMYDLAREGDLPASVRLVDNMQFQFSMALKPRAAGWRAVKSRAEKWVITRVLGYDPQRMVACTLLFEGRRREVDAQQAIVYRLARRHGGIKAGGENGRRGYQLTFSIAYIRDFVMNHHLLGESFETSVPWDRILDVCRNVETRLHDEHRKRGLPGRPFLCSRVTQIYQTGVCVYFYFGVSYKGVEDPSRVYAEMELAARQAILDAGGSLSHHHGVGKIRERFLPQIMSPAVREWNRRTKQAVDPRNVFGSRNQGVVP